MYQGKTLKDMNSSLKKKGEKNDCVYSAVSACAHVLEYTEGQKVFLCLGSKSVGNYSIST